MGTLLGGAAGGFVAGQELRQRGTELAQRQQAIGQNQQQDLANQADKIIGDHLGIISNVIKQARTSGATPDKIQAAIEPLLADIDKLGGAVGRDTSNIRKSVTAQLSLPIAPSEEKVGGTLEAVKAKIAKGEALSEGEQQLYKDSLSSGKNDLADLLQQLGVGTETAPTAPPATASQSQKMVPQSKGSLALPRDKALLEKGQVYDLPDGRQGLWNGTAFEIL